MLKEPETLNEVTLHAEHVLQALLADVPVLSLEKMTAVGRSDRGYDFLAEIEHHGQRHVLICEVKSKGQPRHVREALLKLRSAARDFEPPATPLFIAPFLSKDSQAICREFDVGFVDFEGNARITFDSVYIERQVDTTPPAMRRSIKSVFKPKSAQVLRVLLRDPHRAWRVSELAQSADVSLGHVSNVRAELVDREWAQITDNGLSLSRPDALLDSWRDSYDSPAGKRGSYYTTLHGAPFEEAVRRALGAYPPGPKAMLASFSAAHWLAPYGRINTQYLYANPSGLARLSHILQLQATSSGGNVIVTVLKDEGLFNDGVEAAPGIFATSPVQTYLDLTVSGERGIEAADHLRQEALQW